MQGGVSSSGVGGLLNNLLGGSTIGGATLSTPQNAMPTIGANGQVQQAQPGAMPTATPNSGAYNMMMGALTGNPQFSPGAAQAHQTMQNVGQAATQMGQAPQGAPQQSQQALQQLIQQMMAQRANTGGSAAALSSFAPWLQGRS